MARKKSDVPATPRNTAANTDTKRFNNQGSVSWEKTRSCWLATLMVGYNKAGNAQRIAKRFYVRPGSQLARHFPTERHAKVAAEKWLVEQSKLKELGKLTSKVVTVAEIAGLWLEEKRRAKRAASTLATYEDAARAWILPYLGSTKLRELNKNHLRQWFKDMAKDGGSDFVIANAYRYLKLILNFAENEELGYFKPLKTLEVYKPPRKPRTRWTAEETAQALRWSNEHDPWLFRYMYLVLGCDLRREEALGLRWSNVHLSPTNSLPFVDIVEAATIIRGKFYFGPTKTKTHRRVYFHQDLAHVLLEQKDAAKHRRELAQANQKPWLEHDLVFPYHDGQPWKEGALRRSWYKMIEEAKVTSIVPYDLRSTAISLRDEVSLVPEYVLAARAGHSPAVRREHYQRSVKAQQEAAALTLEEMLGQEVGK
jgi:integrase